MKVYQFQELDRINRQETDPFDIAFRSVRVLTGKTEDEVSAMSVAKFNKYCQRAASEFVIQVKKPPKVVRANGRWYRVIYNAAETAGRYVEGVEFASNDMIIDNLHKIMASCVQPMTWYGKVLPYEAKDHAKYAEDMKHADFSSVYSAAVFFYQLYIELMKASRNYIHEMMIKTGATQQEVQRLHGMIDALAGLPQPNKWRN